jgi:hypothetical protein
MAAGSRIVPGDKGAAQEHEKPFTEPTGFLKTRDRPPL